MNIITLSSVEMLSYQEQIGTLLNTVFPHADLQVQPNEELLAYALAMEEETVVGSASVHVREMAQNERRFLAGIIGGVAVHPDWRGYGIAKSLLSALETQMMQHCVDVSFLFAYEPAIYESSGYTRLCAPIYHHDPRDHTWKSFVYRGGMSKKLSSMALDVDSEIDFGGCVY